jgi:hypothetical protein
MLGCTLALASGMSHIFQFLPWSEEMAMTGRSVFVIAASACTGEVHRQHPITAETDQNRHLGHSMQLIETEWH